MLLIRGQNNLREEHRGCVATIGNFDGVHLGHQAVLQALKLRAEQLKLPSLVIVFEPQPLEFFRPAEAPARLTRMRDKISLLDEAGIDRVLLLRFDQNLAEQTAEDFIQRILVDGLAIQYLYVGDDFCFGKERQGNFQLLLAEGVKHKFVVESLATVTFEDVRASSTRIRKALAEGDLKTAEQCLGRSYQVIGRVAHGHKRGRTIGFPTLNINLGRLNSPVKGVFAVQVNGLTSSTLNGVANVGDRPILKDDDHFLLEVHLFDFDQEVYGQQVSVSFVKRLRDEKNFDSFDVMREQIVLDAEMARIACDEYTEINSVSDEL